VTLQQLPHVRSHLRPLAGAGTHGGAGASERVVLLHDGTWQAWSAAGARAGAATARLSGVLPPFSRIIMPPKWRGAHGGRVPPRAPCMR
jgi:hypothetical protein